MASTRKTKPALTRQTTKRGMHTCPKCKSGFVQPTRWFEQGDRRWHVDLRCPECEWSGRGNYSQDAVDVFDEELDRGCQELMEDLRTLSRANMEEDVERFASALNANDILPEDF